MKQPVDTIKHVFVLYKLATVGLLDASVHSCDEAGLIFKHAGNSVFHQLLGVLAIGGGHLLKPRFNVGREMYFHAFKIREKRRGCNGVAPFAALVIRVPLRIDQSSQSAKQVPPSPWAPRLPYTDTCNGVPACQELAVLPLQ